MNAGKRLLYLVGEPGAGKSSLMARLTEGHPRVPVSQGGLARDLIVDPPSGEVVAVELGRRRGAFSGTDALGMAVIGAAEAYLPRCEAPVLLAEGARLGNARFLSAAVRSGYAVTLALLEHDDAPAWRRGRSARLGKTQDPSWVAGRRTASRRLADSPPDGVEVLRGHPDVLLPMLEEEWP